MRSLNTVCASRAPLLAALAGAALIGFGLGAAGAQNAAVGNNSQIATADPGAAAPADVPPAAPANSTAKTRTAQGQAPIIAPPPAAPAAEACDDLCVRRAADYAAQACVPLIEAKAAIDFDWLSRPFGGMFTQAEKPRGDGIIRYRGDFDPHPHPKPVAAVRLRMRLRSGRAQDRLGRVASRPSRAARGGRASGGRRGRAASPAKTRAGQGRPGAAGGGGEAEASPAFRRAEPGFDRPGAPAQGASRHAHQDLSNPARRFVSARAGRPRLTAAPQAPSAR